MANTVIFSLVVNTNAESVVTIVVGTVHVIDPRECGRH